MTGLRKQLEDWGAMSERWVAPVAPVALLALRFAVAIPFFRSGLTKWEAPFVLSSGAKYLFTEEFKLHLGFADIAYPAPLVTAFLAGTGEIVLPILLVLGLGTRFAALGIIAMTIIIQLTVPDGLINFHLPWAAMALALLAYGGGMFSVDGLVARFISTRPMALGGKVSS